MASLMIMLSDHAAEKLRLVADGQGLTTEEIARRLLESAAEGPPARDFQKVVDDIFRKNAELYRRLAK